MNKKTLQSESYWKSSTQLPAYSPLKENKDTEVCIVGGGIASLTSAYLLLKAGKKVIVLEGHQLGSGETGNTSAHLSNALDEGYANIIKMHGLKKAKLAADSHTAAIDTIEDICKAENIVCDFVRVDGILFVNDKKDENELKQEYAAAKKCGLDVSFENDKQFGQCLIYKNQAQFHPLAYLEQLAECIVKMGGEIYENTWVCKINEKPLQAITDSKFKVSCKKLITAVDGQFNVPMSMHFKLNPQRSYAIASKIPKGSIPHKLYWDTDEPYHYVRVQKFKQGEDLLIVGGEDHRVGIMPQHNPYSSLLSWAKKKFSNNALEIDFQWSGQIIEPIDYLAYIGTNPKNKNIFMITGDSGHGLTHGTIAGCLFTDLILNKKNPWRELYKVDRFCLRSLPKLLANSIASGKAYIKHLVPQFTKLPKKCEGKILQEGVKKVAVFKDAQGNLKKCSAYCPHMGAILTWNSLENSWDCAAHGSRFDSNGKPLNPPTMRCMKHETKE